LNNSAKNDPILTMFGVQISNEISRQKMVTLPTSREQYRRTIL